MACKKGHQLYKSLTWIIAGEVVEIVKERRALNYHGLSANDLSADAFGNLLTSILKLIVDLAVSRIPVILLKHNRHSYDDDKGHNDHDNGPDTGPNPRLPAPDAWIPRPVPSWYLR